MNPAYSENVCELLCNLDLELTQGSHSLKEDGKPPRNPLNNVTSEATNVVSGADVKTLKYKSLWKCAPVFNSPFPKCPSLSPNTHT